MKNPRTIKSFSNLFLFAMLMLSLTSCELAGSIFKGGMWTGVILVFLFFAGIVWLLSRLFGGGK